MEFKIDEKIKLGVATASTQIEGGENNSNWNYWYRKGMIKDGSNPARANDHYNLFRQDADLMAELNIQCYRMSIEWARLEPERGKYNEEAFNHYKEEISYLQSKGIEVLLTLYHFSHPMWFENIGGFENSQSPEIFEGFVRKAVSELGENVDRYVTVNEPNVYATSAYYFGEFPPGKKSVRSAIKVMSNLAAAHIRAYKAIHELKKGKEVYVGYASHVRVFEPENPESIIDRIGCRLMEKMFQGGIDETAMTGKRAFPLKRRKEFVEGKYYDFIGINYYSRSMVKGFDERAKKDAPHNDMGWEIYPEGLETVVEKYYSKFKAPIYITENGTPDREDAFRAKFIYDHLKKLSECNADVRRYYHWTFIDNFEWMDGEHERFGLVGLDYETQKRMPRQSAYMYAEVIKQHGFTNEIINRYLKNERKDS